MAWQHEWVHILAQDDGSNKKIPSFLQGIKPLCLNVPGLQLALGCGNSGIPI